MLPLEQLQKLQSQSNTAIDGLQELLTGLNTKLERIQGDSSRSPAYIKERVKIERDKALPIATRLLDAVRDVNKQTAVTKKFWDSKPFLLSLQRYDEDMAIDAAVKLQKAQELDRMSPPLLDLVLKNAVDEVNLALIYQIWLTGHSKLVGGAKEYVEIANLPAELIIPEQPAALAAIAQCHSNVSFAESIAVQVAGLRVSPAQKINIGRSQNVASRFVEAAEAVKPAHTNG